MAQLAEDRGRRIGKAVDATETGSQHVLQVPDDTTGSGDADIVVVDVTAVVGVYDVLRKDGANKKRKSGQLRLEKSGVCVCV